MLMMIHNVTLRRCRGKKGRLRHKIRKVPQDSKLVCMAVSWPRPEGAAMAPHATNTTALIQTFLAHGTILHTTGKALSVV
jgi:hypothetical protein